MALDLPPAPDQAWARPRSSREGCWVAALLGGLALLGALACGGVVALMSFSVGQQSQMAGRDLDPFFQALVDEDYERAAGLAGKDVDPRRLEEIVEYRVGAPLESFSIRPGTFSMDMSTFPEEPGMIVTYDLKGSREESSVEVHGVGAPGAPGGAIRIPEWSFAPEAAAVAGPERADGRAERDDRSAIGEPTETVVLTDPGLRKMEVIRVLREELDLGLAEAKDLVDSAPAVVAEDIPGAEADALMDALHAAGAFAELE